uniref:Sulfotransferase domain-containing protein n=1 Tax=viral metagenome TaxID=1070528 RepID=A0A6C0CTS6_9ZZZZ
MMLSSTNTLMLIMLWFTLMIGYLSYRVSRKQLPILFIHVPKTGGNSIKKTQFFKRCKYFKHKPITQIKNHKSDYKYSFAVTRNPYDRVVSAFHYLKNGGEPNNAGDLQRQKKLLKYKAFSDFVKDLHLFIHDTHFRPQYTFVCDKNDRILVDCILENETLERDIIKLYEKEGLPVENIPKVNTSKHDNYSKYYDDVNIKNKVYQIYKKDFELFNYTY